MKKEGKWSLEEIDFLKENYPKRGSVFCSEELKRTKNSIRRKVQDLCLKVEVKNNKYLRINFEKIVKSSKSFADVARKLELPLYYGNRQTIKKYIEKYNLDISHFDYGYSNNKNRYVFGKKELKDILIENSTYTHTTNLKDRLYKEGVKKRNCEKCGQGENWNGEKMSLILDHINGINNDNRLENLRIICPNCNATLPTHGGKNKKRTTKGMGVDKKDECKCGNEKWSCSKMCVECSSKKQRKIERPTYKQLVADIEELGYCGTGRKYGVSDNAIRKWKKNAKEK